MGRAWLGLTHMAPLSSCFSLRCEFVLSSFFRGFVDSTRLVEFVPTIFVFFASGDNVSFGVTLREGRRAGDVMVVGGERILSFTPGPLSPWDKKTETRRVPGLPSPRVHRGSLIYDREWLSSGLQGTVAGIAQVGRNRGPPCTCQKTALSPLERCPLSAGQLPSPLERALYLLCNRRGWPGREIPAHRPPHPLTIATSGTPQVWHRRRGGFLPGYRNRDLHPDGREQLQFARRRAGKTCDCPFVEPEGSRETLKIG